MPALESNALLIDFNWEGAQGNFLGNRYVLSFDLGGGYAGFLFIVGSFLALDFGVTLIHT